MIQSNLKDEQATLNAGAMLASKASAPLLIFLEGDLGAGKTTFVRGFLQALGHEGIVSSPTFTLVEPYTLAEKSIVHFDLYRIETPVALEEMGIRDYFDEAAILLVEWPARAGGALPQPDVTFTFTVLPQGRALEITASTPTGQRLLESLKDETKDL